MSEAQDESNWDNRYATRSSRMQASEIRELLKLLDQPDIISFAGGIPDPHLFAAEDMRNAYSDVLSKNANAALQYSTSEGYEPLRHWLTDYMSKIGVKCTPDNIMIVSGSQQALDYCGKLFLSPNDTALVTRPAYLGALQAFNAYEAHYDFISPESGNRTPQSYKDEAAKAGGRPKFAYLTPDFANPTGDTISREARMKLLALADELDIVVLEDSAYQGLRYSGEHVPPIISLDLERNGGDIEKIRTLYSGSFSKTVTPGLRLGWICGPKEVIRKLVLIKQAADLHTPTINQMVMYQVVSNIFDKQVDKIRKAYHHRRDQMLAALEKYMPASASWTKPEGGMFIWLTVKEGLDSKELLAKSLETERVAFVPGKAFFADGSGANTMRLSYSLASDEEIDQGIMRLARLIKSYE
ncbi:PLP-dependent aminotransferase family protein [Microvirga sp. W0021]|uniref:8-amino-7-oxononanoate synthase n=1 Tax=Hohaiivirga grylli TaxID=3133970 RepID=A0ABV0BQ70_9HYPH